METFDKFKLPKPLRNAISDLGFSSPTPIQEEAFSVVMSGKDIVGIAQTGTGKTFAYLLPILKDLKFSNQITPRILILVPTRELVIQVVESVDSLTEYMNIRALGIYGGVNINTQKQVVAEGCDIVVATPGRLYDLVLSQSLHLKTVKRVVIDEVDVMLDLGFRGQLTNILELLPERRQNIMFSATMTDHVDKMIDDYFIAPAKIAIAVSGTPLDNISQVCYPVVNFYTKINLLIHLIKDREVYSKVLVFVSYKRNADKLHAALEEVFGSGIGVIHSNKSQNYRIRSIEGFDEGQTRVLVTTDVMARGLDLDKITHVFNFDTPNFPENYMHRIGRTGRAEKEGASILFYTPAELEYKEQIEELMSYKIPEEKFPAEVAYSKELLYEEREKDELGQTLNRSDIVDTTNRGVHEKKDKNKKTNLGGSYKRKVEKKYKKAQTRGDKTYHKKQKRG